MSELLLKIASAKGLDPSKREEIDWESSATKRGKPKWDQLKSNGGYPLEIVGVPYGGQYEGRDADGEAFYTKTDIVLNPGDIVPLTYYHGFGPDDQTKTQNPPEIIGLAKYRGEADAGHYFDGLVDPTTPLGLRVKDKSQAGADVKASSGSINYLVRIGKGGLIEYWPVSELSIFDTNEWRKPANTNATVTAKGNYHEQQALGGAEDASLEGNDVEDHKQTNVKSKKSKGVTKEMPEKNDNNKAPTTEGQTLDAEAIKAAMSESMKEMINEAVEKSTKAAKEAMDAALEEFKASLPENEEGAELDGGAPAYVRSESLGDVEPKAAFLHWVRTGEFMKGAKAALNVGTPANGGVLVPDDEYRQILALRDEASIPRTMGATTFTTNRERLNIPYEATSLAKFTQVAEEGDVTAAEDEPTFNSLPVDVYKFVKLIKVSEELLEDDNAGLESFLTDALGRALAATENYYALVGAGTTEPEGALVGGTAAPAFAAIADITPAEVIALKYQLSQVYRDNSSAWTMNETTEAILRAKTGTPFVFATTPRGTGNRKLETMEGYPVFDNSNMPEATTGNKSLLFGNWRYYAIVTNRGLRVRRLNELYAETGQVGILASIRFGGRVLLPEAFVYGTQA